MNAPSGATAEFGDVVSTKPRNKGSRKRINAMEKLTDLRN
jgi:hypothetical protein